MSKLVGTKPYQTPRNADLGTLAYQDADYLNLENSIIKGPTYLSSNFNSETGIAGNGFSDYVLIYNATVKDADAGDLNSAGNNGSATLLLTKGTDINLMNLGSINNSPQSDAASTASPLKVIPDGYQIACRSVIIGDYNTSGDGGQSNPMLMRHSEDHANTWYDWEFSTNYYHSYWGNYYLIHSPWLPISTGQSTVRRNYWLGVRSASPLDLRYMKIFIQVAYVPEQ